MNLANGDGHIIETGSYPLPRQVATDLHVPGMFTLEFTAPYIEPSSNSGAIDIASQSTLLELYSAVESLSEARTLCVTDLSIEAELDLIIASEAYLSQLKGLSEEMLSRSTIQDVIDVIWHIHNDRLSKLLEVLVTGDDEVYRAFVEVESEFKQECLERIDCDLPDIMWNEEDIQDEDVRIIKKHLDTLSRELITYENEQAVLAGNLRDDV